MQSRSLLLSTTLGLLLLSSSTFAQDCDCDHVLEVADTVVDGASLGVTAGQSICVRGGERPFLRLNNIVGSEAEPILIKNCEGQVEIDNDDRGYGLTLSASSFLRITGTGDPNHEYGFKVRAAKDGPDYSASCIIASGKSTNYEIDHIEAYECGFAGVSAKTDPTCEEQDLSGFVQRNSRLHHLYLHDTGGEGIYFGSTGYPSRTGNCDGQSVDLIPHTHEGVWIHDNLIEDTGWDGAQIGVSPKDCFFFNNRISRVGLEGVEYQMQGFQVGGGSSCEVYSNILQEGSASGIIVLDAADMRIYNNLVVGFEQGIYINDRDAADSAGARYQVLHNTIVESNERGLMLFGDNSADNLIANNLIVAGGATPLGIGGEVDARDEGNLIFASTSEAKFAAAATGDFSLSADAAAVDAGVDLMSDALELDLLGAERDAQVDVGAYEFGAPLPDEPLGPPPATGGGGTPGREERGEGCSLDSKTAFGAASPSWMTWSLGFVLLLLAGRRRRQLG